jgi:ketosteroid isomerase-like protein
VSLRGRRSRRARDDAAAPRTRSGSPHLRRGRTGIDPVRLAFRDRERPRQRRPDGVCQLRRIEGHDEQASTERTTGRASDIFRALDAKDEAALCAAFTDDPQKTDEMMRGWLRGRSALEAYFTENLPRVTDIHSTVDDVQVRRWGDVEVETFVLRQSYVHDGTPYAIEAPGTVIWRRKGDIWKLALVHSIPLSPASYKIEGQILPGDPPTP